MAGLGALDDLAFELMRDLSLEFGGTGKLEAGTSITGGNATTDPTIVSTTFDNIPITPPSPFVQSVGGQEIAVRDQRLTGMIETYVSAENVTTEPKPEISFLTIYQTDYKTAAITNKRLKVMEVNPVMGGNKLAGYQLICEGKH
jgi:hypothetical protein